MTIRKIVLLNNENVVVLPITFNDENLLEQGYLAGYLSNPKFVEVPADSPADIGWSFINGEAIKI